MKICKRLPGTINTLQFVSNWFEDFYLRKAMDERFISNHYVVWMLLDGILRGSIQVYGVFDVKNGEADDFAGLCFGWITEDEYFECHLAFDRDEDAMECARLCQERLQEENPEVKGVVGYIPDRNRAARMFAKRFGCRDNGIQQDKLFLKDGMAYACREFRKDF